MYQTVFNMFYRKFLIVSFIGSLIVFVTGMAILPQIGGAIPMGENPDTFYENQRKNILNSSGFKMAIAGAALAILILILLVKNNLYEEEIAYAKEVRRAQVVPYPQVQAQVKPEVKPQVKPEVKPQVKPLPQQNLEELKEIVVVRPYPEVQHVTHELTVRQMEPVKNMVRFGPTAPRVPVLPLRQFKYPPPYEAFNKK